MKKKNINVKKTQKLVGKWLQCKRDVRDFIILDMRLRIYDYVMENG